MGLLKIKDEQNKGTWAFLRPSLGKKGQRAQLLPKVWLKGGAAGCRLGWLMKLAQDGLE